MHLRTPLVTFAAVIALLPLAPVGPATALAPEASQTALISASASGAPGTSASARPAVSADGRWVAFGSASALTATPHAPGTRQVYLRDTSTDTTTMISTVGGLSADADAMSPSISADGRFVAYLSGALNLGARGGVPQAILWSRDTGTSRVVSLSYDPVPLPADGTVFSLDLSADGSTLAIATKAANLTPADTHSSIQVYTIGISSGSTTLVSQDLNSTTVTGGSGDSASPSISSDGRTVAFESVADLLAPLNGGHQQIYVRRSDGTLQLVTYSRGTNHGANRTTSSPDVSGDGRTVAFVSAATDLVEEPVDDTVQIFVRTLDSGVTRLASYAATGTRGGNRASGSPVLSHSGDVIAFESLASDLTPQPASAETQIFRRNLVSGEVTLVSASRSGSAASGISNDPTITGDGRYVAFQSAADDLTTSPPTGTTQVYLRNTSPTPRVERIGGADRFEVSAHVSAASFAPHVQVAYIASGDGFADALAGSAAAGFQHAPVLLVTKDAVPVAVATELQRLKPTTIVILGGANSISAATERALREFAGTVERIGGADRYEVAAAVSARVFPTVVGGSQVAYVASGEVFPDALSGSAVAGASGAPVLLTPKGSLPEAVANELRRLAPRAIVVLGGVNTVSDSVVAALGGLATDAQRIGGADRYEVSANVAGSVLQRLGSTVYIASGEKFPDALSGSSAAVTTSSPVLLVTSASIPPAVAERIKKLAPRRIVVLGGPSTVSEKVLDELAAFLPK